MIQLTIIALLAILSNFLLDGNWKAGILLTIVIGFLQDPIRKLTPDQPSWLVGLALISFTMCAWVLYSKSRGVINLNLIISKCPALGTWLPIFIYLIGFQFFNSVIRFNDPIKASIGAAFYLVPLAAMWIGFNVGLDEVLLKRILLCYLALSTVYGISVFMGWQGNDNVLLNEVGEGIEIVFRHGFHDHGASGLWRTSEIAAWQLATAASLSVVMAIGVARADYKVMLVLLAVGFSFLTILTGRRKGLSMVIVFVGTYLVLLSKRTTASKRESLILSTIGVFGLSVFTISTFIAPMLGWRFGEYWQRAMSISGAESGNRFQEQGIGALLRGIEISNGIGFGLGAGGQTGDIVVAETRKLAGQSVGYVSEGGGGRLALELGIPGLIVVLLLGVLVLLLIRRNYSDLSYLTSESASLRIGLLSIFLSNIPFFFSAAQLYSDPFVLILMSVCFGAYLAVPVLARHALYLQHQKELIYQYYLQNTSISEMDANTG